VNDAEYTVTMPSMIEMRAILFNGLLLCLVGSIESLMTAEVVSTMTETVHDSGMVVAAMGVGNILSGMLGGMGGNAMIGLSTIVCLNGGGKSRIAPVTTACLIFAMCAFAFPVLNYIPLSSLVGIMMIVILHTFKWYFVPVLLTTLLPMSVRDGVQRLSARMIPAGQRAGGHHGLRMQQKIDRMDALIVFVVTLLTLLTNLVYAVGVGLLISCARFSWSISSELRVTHETEIAHGHPRKTYTVDGPLFFASSKRFTSAITERDDPDDVEIHFAHGELFDYTAIAALAAVARRYEAVGKRVVFRRLSARSVKRVAKAAHLVSEIQIGTQIGAPSPSPASSATTPNRIVRAASYDSLALDVAVHEAEGEGPDPLSGASITARDRAAHPGLTFASGFSGVKRHRKPKYKRGHVQLTEENDDSIVI